MIVYAKRFIKRLLWKKPRIYKTVHDKGGIKSLIDDVFSVPIDESVIQIYQPIENMEELFSWIDDLRKLDLRFVKSATFKDFRLEKILWNVSVLKWNNNIFKYFNKCSFFYKKKNPSSLNKDLFIVIPGSGIDEACKILYDDPYDYHNINGNIVNFLSNYGDVILLHSFNEDYMKLYNNNLRRLNYDYLIATLLNQGASYDLINVLCLKNILSYFRDKYTNITLVGLSKGGEYAILASILFPNYASRVISCSGYSVIFDKIEKKGFSQILIPGLKKVLNKENILLNKKTKYLFCYGKYDEDIYSLEYEQKFTERALAGCNTKFCYHQGLHTFDFVCIKKFLESN